jgi:branched-chain amino acid transport system ATP-binding protein
MPLLDLDGIRAFHGDVQVLWDISLHVEAGEIVSVVGGNGAGKSTMLKAISGVISSGPGRIWFLEEPVETLPPHRRVALGLVQIPEGRRIFPYMTVLGNLEMGSFNVRARGKKEEALGRVFSLFPLLLERKNQLARTLSGGEQQMLAIGRGLMAQPKLLMMDEPSLGLAPIIVKMIFDTVRSINDQGVTVLLVEQNVKQCLELSNRGYVLENGRIVLDGTGEALLQNEHLRRAYLGL